MRTNSQLQEDVQKALRWEVLLSTSEISVRVTDGAVTLSGVVDSYFKKTEAMNAARRVSGVKALAEHIEVKFVSSWHKADTEVANELLYSFRNNAIIPEGSVSVQVEDGWVTLTGDVPWHYQRVVAENAVTHLAGVKGITNNLKIKSNGLLHDGIDQERIGYAIARHWGIDTGDMYVTVNDATVTFSGTVTSLYQKNEVARIAWNTPGIRHVINKLTVDFEYVLA